MGQHCTRDVGKAGHLLQVIVADVVAGLFQVAAPGSGYLSDVRAIDDQPSAICHDWLQLVHDLAGHPDLIVHLGGDAQDGRERPVLVHHVDLAGAIGGLGPGFLHLTGIDAGQLVFRGHHDRHAPFGYGDHVGGARQQPAHRRVLDPDRVPVADHCCEPVEKVQKVASRDAGKQVLEPSREPDHFVRKDGAEDQEQVVRMYSIRVKDRAVDAHRDRFAKQAAGQLGDLGCGKSSHLGQGVRQIPAMVEEAAPRQAAAQVLAIDAIQLQELVLLEKGMRAQGNHIVDLPGQWFKHGTERSNQQRQRAGSGCVWGQHQDPLVPNDRFWDAAPHDVQDILF